MEQDVKSLKLWLKFGLLAAFFVALFAFGSLSGSVSPSGVQRHLLADEQLPQCVEIDTCADAQQNAESTDAACRDDAGFVDYLLFYYCTMENAQLIAILLMMLLAFLMIFILVSITDEFFCPSISSLSSALSLSNNVAGVTFLAIGNAAPDLFASFAASAHGSPSLALSAVLGGAIFIVTVVAAIVSMVADVEVNTVPFLRDVLVLMATVGLLLGCLLFGRFEWWMALGFISLYVVYLASVIAGRHFYQKYQKKKRESMGVVDDEDIDVDADIEMELQEDFSYDAGELDDIDVDEVLLLSNIRSWSGQGKDDDDLSTLETKTRAENLKEELEQLWPWIVSRVAWKEKTLQGKLSFVLLAPLSLAENASIPQTSEAAWAKPFAIVQPIFAPMVFMFAYGLYDTGIPIDGFLIPFWPFVLLLGFLTSILILLTTKLTEPPPYFKLYVVCGFFMSSVWMYIAALELVCILRAMGRIFGVSEEMIGLSAIAWGNSVVDLVANFMVAKRAFATMAYSACFGAPTFNVLFGLGISFAYLSIKTSFQPIIVEFNKLLQCTFVALGVALAATLLVVPLSGFRSPAKYGVALLAIYFAYFGIAIVIELGYADRQ